MSRASEQFLSELHAQTATALMAMINDKDPEVRAKALNSSIRFLKDNGISAIASADDHLSAMHDKVRDLVPSQAELEELARRSPESF